MEAGDDFDLHDLRWIEEIPPWEWSWVKRDYGVPAIDDKVLVEELGVHPDYLGQLREHLSWQGPSPQPIRPTKRCNS